MAKFENKAEAKEALALAKTERKEAKAELKAFEKENKLEVGADHSGDPKLGKKWAKLNSIVEKKEAKIAEIQESLESLKSASTPRASKYEYPEDVVTAADKKRYRTKMRAAAKKAEKGETEEAPKKSKKEKAASEEAPKKSRKAKKEAPVEGDED